MKQIRQVARHSTRKEKSVAGGGGTAYEPVRKHLVTLGILE